MSCETSKIAWSAQWYESVVAWRVCACYKSCPGCRQNMCENRCPNTYFVPSFSHLLLLWKPQRSKVMGVRVFRKGKWKGVVLCCGLNSYNARERKNKTTRISYQKLSGWFEQSAFSHITCKQEINMDSKRCQLSWYAQAARQLNIHLWSFDYYCWGGMRGR